MLASRKKNAIEDPNKLSGPEKAAVVLLALGEDHTYLWESLDEEEIKEVSQAMSSLGTVSASVVETLLVDFVSGMSSTGAIMGSYEQTQRLLSAFMPSEKVDQIMEEIRGPAGRTMWDKLANVNEAVRHPGQDRADPADRVHVQPRPHLKARQPRDDGRNFQQLRSSDREPLHRRS